jgi:hypothetical protein
VLEQQVVLLVYMQNVLLDRKLLSLLLLLLLQVHAVEAHGLEVLLLHLQCLLKADAVGGDLELRVNRSMITEVHFLQAAHNLQLHQLSPLTLLLTCRPCLTRG